jgi:H/ACA ribonucleoprotein complex subunit 4
MERDLYPRRWGLGKQAMEKKKMKAAGQLDKFGRTNDATPAEWSLGYRDYSAPAVPQHKSPAVAEAFSAPAPVATTTSSATPVEPEEKEEVKKRKKHEGETPEEKAERKRLKQEKKAAKAAKKVAKGGDSD